MTIEFSSTKTGMTFLVSVPDIGVGIGANIGSAIGANIGSVYIGAAIVLLSVADIIGIGGDADS